MSPEEFLASFLIVTNSSTGWKWANGQCFMYAYCFTEIMGGKAMSYTNKEKTGHCFIYYKGKYYDSECYAGGQNKWKHLQPYLVRVPNKVMRHNSSLGVSRKWKMLPEQIEECEKIIAHIKSFIS